MLNKNSYYLMLAGLIAMPGTALGDDCSMFKEMFDCVRENYPTLSADYLFEEWNWICERCNPYNYDACTDAHDSVGGAFYNCWSAGYKVTAAGCIAANDGEVTDICPQNTNNCCAQGEYWDEVEESCYPCPGAYIMIDDTEVFLGERTNPGSGCYPVTACYIPNYVTHDIENDYGYATLKLGSHCYHNGSI